MILNAQIAQAHNTGTTFARYDGKLDGAQLPNLASTRRSPGKFDLMARHLVFTASCRRLQILDHMPPHIAAGSIDQFDLQMIRRPGAAQAKAQGKGCGQELLVHTPCDHKTTPAFEIEIHVQRLILRR